MAAPVTEFRYPCDNCGAALVFRPGQDSLICPYCGHEQKIGPGAARAPGLQPDPQEPDRPALQWDSAHKNPGLQEIPLDRGLRIDRDSDLTESVRTLSCPNCGAKIDQGDAQHALLCPFCATPVVTDTGATRQIKPQGVLPFIVTQEQARDSLDRWLGSLWFAPNGLSQYARRQRQMSGIYSPYWTFDADTQTAYSGSRGDDYFETVYVTVNVNGRMQQQAQQVVRTRWTPVSGRVARRFDDVLVIAATSLPRSYTDALAPWDLSHLNSYDPRYLAGFQAEGYTVPLADGHQFARAEMAKVIANDIRRDIGGDRQQISGADTQHRDETFKHVLLPIWSAAYKYNGKSYRFVVNGQTGRVQGERPYSIWKIALAILLALIAAAVFMYFADESGLISISDSGGGSSYSRGAGPMYDSGGGYVIRGY